MKNDIKSKIEKYIDDIDSRVSESKNILDANNLALVFLSDSLEKYKFIYRDTKYVYEMHDLILNDIKSKFDGIDEKKIISFLNRNFIFSEKIFSEGFIAISMIIISILLVAIAWNIAGFTYEMNERNFIILTCLTICSLVASGLMLFLIEIFFCNVRLFSIKKDF